MKQPFYEQQKFYVRQHLKKYIYFQNNSCRINTLLNLLLLTITMICDRKFRQQLSDNHQKPTKGDRLILLKSLAMSKYHY